MGGLRKVGNWEGAPRDNQKSRLYDAEGVGPASKAAAKYLHNGPTVRSTGNVSIEACQSYLDHVLTAAWFQRRWGRRTVNIVHKVYGSATGGHGLIALPPWSRTESVILHELAHCLTDSGRWASHGPEFAGLLLTLVKHVQGAEAAKEQRAKFRQYKVRYNMAAVPAPTRPVVARSEQQSKARAAAKAEKDRAARVARQRLDNIANRREAAALIRTAVEAGWYGPPGTPARRQALATARTMEFPGKSKHVLAVREAEEEARREERRAAHG